MIHWAEFYFVDGNFRRFPYLNIDLGKAFYPPLFELCDKEVDIIITRMVTGFMLASSLRMNRRHPFA